MIFRKKKYQFEKLDDMELIHVFLHDKNHLSITILYERYAHLVMGSCLKYLKNKENAQDITLKIFGELAEKLEKHTIQHFKSWLYQVTRNECLMYLRKQKGKHQQQIETIPLADSNDEESALIIEKEEQLVLLEQAINTLKDEQKQCIELFYLQDHSYQEISDTLDISLNTVKSAIQNGKRNIKIWMERHEDNKTRA